MNYEKSKIEVDLSYQIDIAVVGLSKHNMNSDMLNKVELKRATSRSFNPFG